ncbi:hypothetical protein VTN00DRAFT_5602 [Thermoascus crustaceus]|uniref:uncharacterized protein n=1 Tax=Thermoascus crustaceus TaxID=5088 RepID=UPI0037426D1F
MSSDFWAGYLSGAIGIIIGNPLDLVKVRLQAGHSVSGPVATPRSLRQQFESTSSLVRGAAAPILGYGALNALLFVAYNRVLMFMDRSVTDPTNPEGVPLYKIWVAGAAGGLASWAVSSPTELIKCRAQLSSRSEVSSWAVTKDIFRRHGWKGLYFGGAVTSVRDSVGYGFYFWSYELCKRYMATENESAHQAAMKVLFCGGIAGIVTWASVFPLDVIKTRLQAQMAGSPLLNVYPEGQSLLRPSTTHSGRTLNSFEIAKEAYRTEGLKVFYRGLGICSIRAFIVNAVQWATYEWLMKALNGTWGNVYDHVS